MQLCDPPITVANLQVGSGYQGSDTTLFDKDSITTGLLYDTAAAAARCNVSEENPDDVWRFSLSYVVYEDARSDAPEQDA